jgi:hypothetical protein
MGVFTACLKNRPASTSWHPDPDKPVSVQDLRLDQTLHLRFTRCMTIFSRPTDAHAAPFRGLPQRAIAALLRGLIDVFHHGDLPGYQQLPWITRCRINWRALCAFIGSHRFIQLSLWLTVWLLSSYLLIWHYDLHGPLAAALPLLALLWVLPYCAHARRNAIARLLNHRWPV